MAVLIDTLSPEMIADIRERYTDTNETVTSIVRGLGLNRSQFYDLREQQGWPMRRPPELTFGARLARLPPPGAPAPREPHATEPPAAASAMAPQGTSDADLASALRGLVLRAVQAIQAEWTSRPRGAATRALREIGPLTRAVEDLWRIEDALKQRAPQPEESDRSLNELRDDLYNRLMRLRDDSPPDWQANREAAQRADGSGAGPRWRAPSNDVDQGEM